MRIIDGDKLLARYKERCAGCKETKNYCEHCCDIADVIEDIEDEPTIDIVRCEECKYCDSFPNKSDATMPLKCLSIRYGGVCPDWFCEHGERRKDNG